MSVVSFAADQKPCVIFNSLAVLRKIENFFGIAQNNLWKFQKPYADFALRLNTKKRYRNNRRKEKQRRPMKTKAKRKTKERISFNPSIQWPKRRTDTFLSPSPCHIGRQSPFLLNFLSFRSAFIVFHFCHFTFYAISRSFSYPFVQFLIYG